MSDSEPRTGGGRRQHDPLLTTVWWLLSALLVVCAVLGVFCLLAYPVILINYDYFAPRFAESGIRGGDLYWIGLLGVVSAIVLAFIWLFLRNLRRMIDSVAAGRPFERVNADRLRQMAWLSVGAQIAAIPMMKLMIWLDAAPYKPNVHHNDDGISMGSIVLTLVLFVLARVFRTGADMQEDLEGTV